MTPSKKAVRTRAAVRAAGKAAPIDRRRTAAGGAGGAKFAPIDRRRVLRGVLGTAAARWRRGDFFVWLAGELGLAGWLGLAPKAAAPVRVVRPVRPRPPRPIPADRLWVVSQPGPAPAPEPEPAPEPAPAPSRAEAFARARLQADPREALRWYLVAGAAAWREGPLEPDAIDVSALFGAAELLAAHPALGLKADGTRIVHPARLYRRAAERGAAGTGELAEACRAALAADTAAGYRRAALLALGPAPALSPREPDDFAPTLGGA